MINNTEKAKEQLLDIITKINGQTKEMFAETFAKIRDNFRAMFTEVFGGGKADLVLTDEGDVLEIVRVIDSHRDIAPLFDSDDQN